MLNRLVFRHFHADDCGQLIFNSLAFFSSPDQPLRVTLAL